MGGSTLELADRIARDFDARVAEIEELAARKIDVEAEELRITFELEEDFHEIDRRNLAAIKDDRAIHLTGLTTMCCGGVVNKLEVDRPMLTSQSIDSDIMGRLISTLIVGGC